MLPDDAQRGPFRIAQPFDSAAVENARRIAQSTSPPVFLADVTEIDSVRCLLV